MNNYTCRFYYAIRVVNCECACILSFQLYMHMNIRGGPTCVQESLRTLMSLRSRDNVQAKCTELVVIRARMSDLLYTVKTSGLFQH